MLALRCAGLCCFAFLSFSEFARPVQAAILYQFTTANSSTAPNDDGYVPTDVTISMAPGVIGPVDGAALALGNTGLNRFWNSEFAGFSLSDENGTNLDSAAEFGTGYFTWTVSAEPGNKLNLLSLDFGSARGGNTVVRGFELYAAVNGGPFTFGDTPLLDVNDEVVSATRTSPRPVSIDLSAPLYQDIDSITFRYYPLTAATGNTIEFTGMTLNGEVAAIPEPSSLLAALGIIATAWAARRGKLL
jgi:hypothetical protein